MSDQQIAITDARLQRLYAYWLEKRGARLAPTRSDMNAADLKFVLPYTFSLDIVGGRRYRYRLAGSELEKEFGSALTGKFVEEIDPDHVRNDLIAKYESVVRTARPTTLQRHFLKSDGRDIECECLVLPLSTDGMAIDLLFGAAAIRGIAPLGHIVSLRASQT
jgi:hypothetical protein